MGGSQSSPCSELPLAGNYDYSLRIDGVVDAEVGSIRARRGRLEIFVVVVRLAGTVGERIVSQQRRGGCRAVPCAHAG
jgi:hypothetical protein